MTVGFYAPYGLRASCGAWARNRADVVPRRDATEIWVFSAAGALPPGAIKRWVGKRPLKFFAVASTTPLGVVPLPHLAPDRLPSREELLSPAARAVDTRAGFADLERRLRAGQSYADMETEIDALLGTSVPERDRDAETEYELQAAERRGETER